MMDRPACFEVTIVGRIGPAVRRALAKWNVTEEQPTYVIELVTGNPDALWQAVEKLAEHGAEPVVLRPVKQTTQLG
jgi:hypothetical protein